MGLGFDDQAIYDGLDDWEQDAMVARRIDSKLADYFSDDDSSLVSKFDEILEKQESVTKDMKKKYKFLKNFMDKQKIKYANDGLPFYESILKRRGSVDYGKFEDFGTKFSIVDKNGEINNLEFEKEGEYVGDHFNIEDEDKKHIPRVETELKPSSAYILEQVYSSDMNQSEVRIFKIPDEHIPHG